MASSDNLDSACAEAKRRAAANQVPYGIYQHLRNEGDYMLRTAKAAPPHIDEWRRIATVKPDGTCSFVGQSIEFQAWWERQIASVT
jgi:hypothetical protein